MYFPKAKVLILNFSSGMYFLPPFIGTMPKLKSLVLINHVPTNTILQNLSSFTDLHNLRSLWVEKIVVPPPPRTTVLKNLQKVSLTQCEPNNSLQGSKVDLSMTFPRLPTLKRISQSICRLKRLRYLGISQCPRYLLEEFGNLKSLEIIDIERMFSEEYPKVIVVIGDSGTCDM
ncbi:probable disease resistance protein At4g33300 [Elaeis guineensis]|uniref:probable disease resistance protein At4g33300 n=1 Tax=Elaeis guineensis var. tenera TaxID=51953 RepID=UPI003C6D6815